MSNRTIGARYGDGRPCPVCGSETKSCSRTDDGLQFCRGDAGTDWKEVGRDDVFGHYRHVEDRTRLNERPAESKPTNEPRIDWQAEAARYATALAQPDREYLADALKLPVDVLSTAMPMLGFKADDQHGLCWTFPESEPDGKIVGIARRYADGRKLAMSGSRRGLTLPSGWGKRPGRLFIVE